MKRILLLAIALIGKNVVLFRAFSGLKTIALPSGIYIVRAGQQTTKVIIS